MLDILRLLELPFLACLVIAGIHCYLGLHVVQRGIIFVDLALAQIAALGTVIALLCLDIDKFKSVNDRLGHAAGDALLKEFAARLRACVRETDTVGRLGGDEFAILLEAQTGEGGASLVAQKILAAMRAPVRAGDTEIVVTTSIGIAILRDASAEDAEALSKRADVALYEAKSAGRNTFRVSNAAGRDG